jgi:hypothetical protein
MAEQVWRKGVSKSRQRFERLYPPRDLRSRCPFPRPSQEKGKTRLPDHPPASSAGGGTEEGGVQGHDRPTP